MESGLATLNGPQTEQKQPISEIAFSFTIGTAFALSLGMTKLNKSHVLSSFMLLASTIAVGCVDDLGAEDPIDESAVAEGKDDAFGVRETDPEAAWVLRAANEMTYAQLVEHGVGKRAAQGLIAARPFVTLTDVDKVPYVGVTAFVRLLEAGNTVPASTDPFSSASCGGTRLDFARGKALLGNEGAISRRLGGQEVKRRVRQCNPVTGCTPWTPAPAKQFESVGCNSGGCGIADLVEERVGVDAYLKVSGTRINVSVEPTLMSAKPYFAWLWNVTNQAATFEIGAASVTNVRPTLSVETVSWTANGPRTTQLLQTSNTKITTGTTCIRYYAYDRDASGKIVSEAVALVAF